MTKIIVDKCALYATIEMARVDSEHQWQLGLTIANFVFAQCYDKQGVDYIQHCLRNAMHPSLKDNKLAQLISLNHDTLEDSDLTAQDLIDYGVDEDVVAGIIYITHPDAQSYNQYIDVMIADYIKYSLVGGILFEIVKSAILAKMSDMLDNSNFNRLVASESDEKSIKRITKYIVNYKKLKKVIDGDFDTENVETL
jgi:hypothetical protein